MFPKVPKNFPRFLGKHLCEIIFFDNVARLKPATLLKKRLWRKYFPEDFAETF